MPEKSSNKTKLRENTCDEMTSEDKINEEKFDKKLQFMDKVISIYNFFPLHAIVNLIGD